MLFDMLGREVIQCKTVGRNVDIDLTSVALGTYLLKIMGDDLQKTVKIVKQ